MHALRATCQSMRILYRVAMWVQGSGVEDFLHNYCCTGLGWSGASTSDAVTECRFEPPQNVDSRHIYPEIEGHNICANGKIHFGLVSGASCRPDQSDPMSDLGKISYCLKPKLGTSALTYGKNKTQWFSCFMVTPKWRQSCILACHMCTVT